jgi:hypothetical protein
VVDVVLHGLVAEHQLGGDVVVGQAPGDQVHHLALARGQPGGEVVRRRRPRLGAQRRHRRRRRRERQGGLAGVGGAHGAEQVPRLEVAVDQVAGRAGA